MHKKSSTCTYTHTFLFVMIMHFVLYFYMKENFLWIVFLLFVSSIVLQEYDHILNPIFPFFCGTTYPLCPFFFIFNYCIVFSLYIFQYVENLSCNSIMEIVNITYMYLYLSIPVCRVSCKPHVSSCWSWRCTSFSLIAPFVHVIFLSGSGVSFLVKCFFSSCSRGSNISRSNIFVSFHPFYKSFFQFISLLKIYSF